MHARLSKVRISSSSLGVDESWGCIFLSQKSVRNHFCIYVCTSLALQHDFADL